MTDKEREWQLRERLELLLGEIDRADERLVEVDMLKHCDLFMAQHLVFKDLLELRADLDQRKQRWVQLKKEMTELDSI